MLKKKISTYALFVCHDCGAVFDQSIIKKEGCFKGTPKNCLEIQIEARKHSKKYNHYVTGEITKEYYYNY
jgi:hypothetical protein